MRSTVLICSRISFATPGIMKDFNSPPDVGLGLVLAMDLLGMAVGSFVLGGVADYIGRRRAILTFLVVMSIGMYMCSHANSREELGVWRFFTGLGIGGMLAAINATAAEFSNDRMRKFWVALMTIGYPLGNILAALIISPLLKTHSWRVVFELGAGATAAHDSGGVVLRAGVRLLAVPQTAGQRARANQSTPCAAWAMPPSTRCRP